MAVRAIAKGVKISPRKVQVVASLVRGRSVADALTILSHTPRLSAVPVRKAIESAKANADYNHGYRPDSLQITEISVQAGIRYKRGRAAARGQYLPFQHRTSNIYVTVDGTKRETKKPATSVKETK